MSYFSSISIRDGANVDAFSRLRTSGTGNRFDVEFIYDKQPLIIDEVTTGAATATHNSTSRDVTLAIVDTNNTTSKALYSHYDIPYTAGNSQLIDVTGTLDNAAIGGGTASLFLRTNVTGSVAETVVNSGSWNKSNPTIASWAYSQILMMDFQSLKIGRIRYYLVIDGVPTLLHEIYNDDVRATGYWQTPTLPVYWRIYNDATYTYMEMGYGDTENAIGIRYRITKNASATMRAVCATVKSEGGVSLFEMPGYPFGISNRTTAITVSTTLIPLLSIRMATTLNSIANRSLAIPIGFGIETDNPINLRIFYRPTLTGPSWVPVDTTYSAMEYDVSSSAITGGVLVDDEHITTQRNILSGTAGLLGRTILSLGRTGTSDILTIAAIRTSSTNAAVKASLSWREIR